MSTVAQARWKTGATTGLVLAVFLAIVFASMRAIGALGPPNLRLLLPLAFVLMAISPWLLLTRSGRREIGLKRPVRPSVYLRSCLFGITAALACFLIGLALFGKGADNWFVSVATSFGRSVDVKLPVLQLYLMFVVAQPFAWLRRHSGSLYPAIASHAAFNFAMGTLIFLALWPVN